MKFTDREAEKQRFFLIYDAFMRMIFMQQEKNISFLSVLSDSSYVSAGGCSGIIIAVLLVNHLNGSEKGWSGPGMNDEILNIIKESFFEFE